MILSITKSNTFFFLTIFFVNFLFSQKSGTDEWSKVSPEFRLNTTKLELRFRPYDLTTLKNKTLASKTVYGRTDLMIGFVHKKLKFFAYLKKDTRNRTFMGPRLDFNTSMLNKKLSLHFQYRYFWGFNDESKHHQYFITLFEYKTNFIFRPGILGYSKQTFGRSTVIFYGPSINIPLTNNLSFLIGVTKDFNSRSRYLTLLRLNIRFKLQDEKAKKFLETF